MGASGDPVAANLVASFAHPDVDAVFKGINSKSVDGILVSYGPDERLRRRLAVGLMLVVGGWARLREQRWHVPTRPARPKGRVDQWVTTPDTQTESGRTQEQGSPGGR
jgi:hypothetical protein